MLHHFTKYFLSVCWPSCELFSSVLKYIILNCSVSNRYYNKCRWPKKIDLLKCFPKNILLMCSRKYLQKFIELIWQTWWWCGKTQIGWRFFCTCKFCVICGTLLVLLNLIEEHNEGFDRTKFFFTDEQSNLKCAENY